MKQFGLLSETDLFTISADYEVPAATSDTGKLKKEVSVITNKIDTVNEDMKTLVMKQKEMEHEREADLGELRDMMK